MTTRKKMYRWFFCFVLVNFIAVRAIEGATTKASGKKQENRSASKSVRDKEEMQTGDESFIPSDFEIVVEALEKIEDPQCKTDVQTTLEAFRTREEWALRMFDASAKFPVGLLDGAFYQLGDFDECIDVKQQDNDYLIQGQYCLVDVDLADNSNRVERSFENFKPRNRYAYNGTVHWAICLPSSCNTTDVATVITEIFVKRITHQNFVVKVEANKCHLRKSEPITALEIIYGTIIGLILVSTMLATAFHYYVIQQRKRCSRLNIEAARECNKSSLLTEFIFCFSIIRNVNKFLHVSPSDMNLECICGIKWISMSFIIVGHSLIFIVGGPVLNPDYYTEGQQSVLSGPFVNNPLLVDSFLLISGFLFCFLLLIELKKRQGKVNFLIIYVARYIRLTPAYFVVLGLYCSWLFRLGNGPLWDSRIALERDRCLASWWANLLYINNYVFTDKICMFQSWYLAVDYHLFIIAPLLVYPLWRWERIGKGVLGATIIISVLIPFLITFFYNLDPTLMTFAPEIADLTTNYYFVVAYIKTHMRASSYFIGIFFGFLVHKLQANAIKIPKTAVYFGWLISSIAGLLSMYSVVIFYIPDHGYNPVEAAIYGAFHRIAWCLFVGWVLVMCITDHAELVNKFLSWKPFVPLSRLTYCAYLVNGIVELYNFGTARVVIYMSYYELFLKTISHMLLTFALAFVLCIICESPIHGIEKLLLKREKTASAQRNESEDSFDDN